ncbi:uncharacterized protein EURHEDRAFT_358157 [Aspergillus ruber CBS 135680]|uniref:Uncharacterized protein n=1 Tax=Aspergillus ruber (strain CBS 135680) TaxID=1388766 RepID=A0A017SIS3_ASPRC|nr:uncharacterized protein EURHEDRAFT_358157 [Aspergillus ruber CBS 135680]EYE96646.1 hypothetical protein EURHEDRAFT_358157 [Aspergillus ruber CBS 135680]
MSDQTDIHLAMPEDVLTIHQLILDLASHQPSLHKVTATPDSLLKTPSFLNDPQTRRRLHSPYCTLSNPRDSLLRPRRHGPLPPRAALRIV